MQAKEKEKNNTYVSTPKGIQNRSKTQATVSCLRDKKHP